ncbi:MAG: DUF4857 domain-containing protein [Desulfovibrionaceae bacterium]|nr:DUF4857 domain-containing protein [Desulfovibrionaceae bacterium]
MSILTFLARQALLLVTCLCCAVWVPAALDALLDLRIVRSMVLFSPVAGDFLVQEYLPAWTQADLPPETAALLEHGMIHRRADGRALSRTDFENALPFLYAEGMRLRGLVPVTIGDTTYDLEALRRGKLILGLRPSEIAPRRNDPGLYALLDSRPDRVNLIFPEDRFRLRDRLEFVNADSNAPDKALTDAVNAALAREGFVFPATAAFGRDTIIKPWDAGWFLLDSQGGLFNLRRVRDAPLVRRVTLPGEARAVHVQVQETRDGGAAALAVGSRNEVFVLYADMSARQLACDGYDPARHWLKVILDPVSETCVFDDEATIGAVRRPSGQDGPLDRLSRKTPSRSGGPGRAAAWFLSPLRLTLLPEDTGFLAPRLSMGGGWSLFGMAVFGLVSAAATFGRVGGMLATVSALCWGALGGLAGACAAILWRPDAADAMDASPRDEVD